ncbi:MAG: metal-dependent hydrolase [Rhodospirillales bacterium]|nr:metal-dependent hydrolase [Rhodospirillales bacterium]
MMAVSHVVIGGALWSLAATAAQQTIEPVALGLSALGALLPDIDHPNSWVGKRLAVVSVPLAAVVGHRGVTHSLIAILALLAFLAPAGLDHAAAPLAVGYLSHLLADALTLSGVPLLWPSKRIYGIPLIRTGSLAEIGLVGALTAAVGALFGDVATLKQAARELNKLLR